MKNNEIYKISSEQSDRINILKMLFTIFVVYIHSNIKDMYGGSVILVVPKWLDILKTFISFTISECSNSGFFLISSILLYRKSFKYFSNIKKKTKTIIIPYIIMNTLQVLVFALFQSLPLTKTFFGNSANKVANFNANKWLQVYGIGSQYPFNGPMWFLRNIFMLNLISLIVKKIIDRFPKTSFVSLVLIYIFVNYNFCFLLYPSYLFFWCLGYYIVKFNININKFDNSKLVIISFVFLSITHILLYILEISLPKYVYEMFILIKMTIDIIFWYSCFTINTNGKIQQLLLKYSSYSFPIYCFHIIVLGFAQKIVLKFFPSTPITLMISYLFLPIVVISMIIMFCYYIKKVVPKLYSVLMGNR